MTTSDRDDGLHQHRDMQRRLGVALLALKRVPHLLRRVRRITVRRIECGIPLHPRVAARVLDSGALACSHLGTHGERLLAALAPRPAVPAVASAAAPPRRAQAAAAASNVLPFRRCRGVRRGA